MSVFFIGASDTADTLFQEVLGRKDKADSTRNALNVLQRFKFLFNLPLNIERNIQKVLYPLKHLQTDDYKLFSPTKRSSRVNYVYNILLVLRLDVLDVLESPL